MSVSVLASLTWLRLTFMKRSFMFCWILVRAGRLPLPFRLASSALAVCVEGSGPGDQVVLQVRHANPEDPWLPDAACCSSLAREVEPGVVSRGEVAMETVD